MDNKMLHMTAMILLWVGGLNWGLYGLFGVNLVQMFFGMGALAQIVYVLVGVSAVYTMMTHMDSCKTCDMSMKPAKKGKRK